MKNKYWKTMAARIMAVVLICLGTLPFPVQAEVEGKEIVILRTAEDLEAMAKSCRLDTWSQGKTFVMENDIDISGRDFSPIPTFGGTFDGGGHTISGLRVEGGSAAQGLFRFIQPGGQVENLKVRGNVQSENGESYIGGIAGNNEGTISGCTFSGAVKGKTGAGGIAGSNKESGQILFCTVEGTVAGEQYTGGIAGQNLGIISECTNKSRVNTLHIETEMTLEETLEERNREEVFDTTADTGGIAGYSSGTIKNCSNEGEIGYAHVGYNVGGIAGRSVGCLDGCTNKGRVLGRKDVGGIIGQQAPNVLLVFSEDTAGKMEAELDAMDALINQSLDHASANGDTVSARLEQLSEYADTASEGVSDLADMTLEKADEGIEAVNDGMDLAGDVLDALEMAAANGESIMEDTAHALDLLDMAAEDLDKALDIGGDGFAGLAQTIQTMKDAAGKGKEGLQIIGNALKTLGDAWSIRDPEEAGRGAAMLKQGIEQAAQSGQTISSALKTIAEALPSGGDQEKIRQALKELSAGLEESAQALRQMGDGASLALGTVDLDWNSLREQLKTIASSAGAFQEAWDQMGQAGGNLKDALLDFSGASGGLGDGASGISNAMDALEGAAWDMGLTADELYDNLWELADRETPRFQTVGEDYRELGDTVHSAFTGMGQQLDSLREELEGTGDTLEADLRSLDAQFGRIADVMLEAFDSLENRDEEALWKDVSEEEIENTVLGKAADCHNYGDVEGDINVGGISGAMGIEYSLDPEDDIAHVGTESLQFHYETRAILQKCVNRGKVTAKKDGCGGVVGRMDLGYLLDCENYGKAESTDGNYIGGIAGKSDSTIRRCWAKCTVSGGDYLGGIAGYALNVYQCTAMVEAEEWGSCLGAVAGDWDREGTLEGNRYIGENLAGADGVSYGGKAEPAAYSDVIAEEGVPEDFRHFTITYEADDVIIRQDAYSYGDPVSRYEPPEIPVKEGYYGQWEEIGEETIAFDHVIEAIYTPYATTLATREMRDEVHPILLAEGQFGGKMELTAEKISGTEEEEQWQVTAEGLEGSLRYRFAPPEEWKQTELTITSDGREETVEAEQDGSCLVFEAGPSFVLTARKAGPQSGKLSGGTAVLIALAVILVVGSAGFGYKRRKKP